MSSLTAPVVVFALSALSPCPPGATLSRIPDLEVDGGVNVVCHTTDGQLDGPVTLTWDGKRKRLTGRFEQGRPVGSWTWWYPDGSKRASYGFTSGEPSGTWETWYPNGKTHWKVVFVNGVPSGPIREGRPDGTTRFEGVFMAGERTGTWRAWRGAAKAGEGTYERGRPSGRWTVWWKTGAVAARRDGERDWSFSDPDGGVLSRSSYDALRRPEAPPTDPLNPFGNLVLVESPNFDPLARPEYVPPFALNVSRIDHPLYPWTELHGVWFDEFLIELGLERPDLDQTSP